MAATLCQRNYRYFPDKHGEKSAGHRATAALRRFNSVQFFSTSLNSHGLYLEAAVQPQRVGMENESRKAVPLT